MEITIGIQNIGRELSLETNQGADEVSKALRSALEDGSVFEVQDSKGRTLLIPAAHIGYVNIGEENARPVGFGALSS